MRTQASWCVGMVTPGNPRFCLARQAFLPLPRTSSTHDSQKLQLFNRGSNKQSKMSQYTIKDNTNCFNTTNSINVQNNLTISHDRPELLAWLSPLDPGLRHCDIRERRAKDVGEWFIQTGEFRRWSGLSEEGEGDKRVLFCSGNPGVGKTFIR